MLCSFGFAWNKFHEPTHLLFLIYPIGLFVLAFGLLRSHRFAIALTMIFFLFSIWSNLKIQGFLPLNVLNVLGVILLIVYIVNENKVKSDQKGGNLS